MQAIRELSIRCKLMWILTLTSSAAMLVACVAFGVYDALTFRHTLECDLATVAEIASQNSARCSGSC